MAGATATDIGGHHENQDRGVIYTAPDGRMFAVVADGHGPHGARAAQWAVDWLVAHPAAPVAGAGTAETFALVDEHIRTRLIAHLEATGRPYMQFGRALYTPGFYGTRGLPIRGGTTLSVAAVSPDGAVSAAHVGDSDIHVFTEGEEGEGVSLMGDHTPTSRAEFERIRASHPGARFICEAAAVGLPAYMNRLVWVPVTAAGAAGPATPAASAAGVDVMLNPEGPFHVADVRESWATYIRTPDDAEGLAMTRALGDYNLQLTAGVSTVPHCQALPAPAAAAADPPIDPAVAGGHGRKERVVVVASDGFWDIVHYAEVAEVIWQAAHRGCSAAAASATAAALIALAKAKTLERLGAPGDNITVSVIRVSVPAPAAEAPAPAAEVVVAEAAPAPAAEAEAVAPPPPEVAPVGGAGAPAPAGHRRDLSAPSGQPLHHSLHDPAVWEAAVTGALPGVAFDSDDGMLPPPGRTPNARQIREGEDEMIRQGVRRGSGVLYYGKGDTQRVLYCSQSGEYWDIVYQRLEGELPTPEALWRIVGFRRWSTHSSPLPQPAPLPHVHLPAGFRSCGCPNSLGINPLNGRSASETLHAVMRAYGGCPCLDFPAELGVPDERPAPP